MSKFDYDPNWRNNRNLEEASILGLLVRAYPLPDTQATRMIKDYSSKMFTPPNIQLFAFLTNQITYDELSNENKDRWGKLKPKHLVHCNYPNGPIGGYGCICGRWK